MIQIYYHIDCDGMRLNGFLNKMVIQNTMCTRECITLKANGYWTTFSIDVDVNKCLTEFVLSVSLCAGDYPSTIRIIPPPSLRH